MQKWNVYQNNSNTTEVVPDGFNWWAFLFCGFWALSKGLKLAGFVGIGIGVISGRLPGEVAGMTLVIIFSMVLVYGFMGNGWVAAALEKKGFSRVMQVEAASREGAIAAYTDSDQASKSKI